MFAAHGPSGLQPVDAQTQVDFLNIAVEQSVEAAVAAHGNILSAGEAQALQNLSAQELTMLRDVTARITEARSSGVSPLANGWTCVNVVC